jgi:hypothetical protein
MNRSEGSGGAGQRCPVSFFAYVLVRCLANMLFASLLYASSLPEYPLLALRNPYAVLLVSHRV